MHRILPCSWIFQGRISWGNLCISSEMRPRLFHQADPRISSYLQSPLPHECTRIGGTQTTVVGVNRERVYLTQCVPLGSTDFIHKEEGRYDADVHWLRLVEQNYYKEPIPATYDWWFVWPGGRSQNIFKDWLVIWLPSGTDLRWRYSQDCLSYEVRALRVCSDAVWVDQCTRKL